MCIDCGCSTPDPHHHHDHDHAHGHEHDHGHDHKTVRIEEDLLAKNNRLAGNNRTLFAGKGLFVLNLVSSPGSGKTTLLERTLGELSGRLGCLVLEGDQQTSNDADRIAATGVPVRQINTGAGCHLDAHMVGHGIEDFDLDAAQVLFIENVGNLVCPASFDLGHHRNVVLLSTTEGDDKPAKYPVMFRAADLMLLTKSDLLPVLDDFSPERAEQCLRRLANAAPVQQLSARKGIGLDGWFDWLRGEVAARREAARKLRPVAKVSGVLR